MSKAISSSLVDFTHKLKSGDKVTVDAHGNWSKASLFLKPLHNLDWFEKRRLEKIARVFSNELDRLERTAIDKPEEVLEAHKALAGQLEPFKNSNRIKRQIAHLDYRISALKYRIEDLTPVIEAQEIDELTKLVESWKENYELYQDKEISVVENIKIFEACRYPEFVKVLKQSKELRTCFFKWALRDNNPIEAFVQFPATCHRLKTCLLAGRTGYFANHFNWIQKKEGKKIFTLPFEGKQINILDESQEVEFKGGYRITIKKVLESFRNKNLNVGNFEFLGKQGICNWHCNELGWWNPEEGKYEKIDLSVENSEWWTRLPVWEEITVDQAKNRYGIESLEEGQWVRVVKSTRESINLDIDRSHGYLEILIPNPNGGFNVYPLGKFAKKFPSSLIEKCLILADTVEARIQFPDENPTYSHRQQSSAPEVITSQKGLELMELIRKDMVSAQEGNIVFQFGWENCAFWPQQKIEQLNPGKGPNFFVASTLESHPKMQPLKALFNVCRVLPEAIKNIALKIVAFLLGYFRGMYVMEAGKRIFKSMKRSGFSKNCEMYHPAYLHHRIQKKKIPGSVYFGNQFAHQMV